MTFLRSALALVFALLLSPAAEALLFRAYVSGDGNDANPCTLPSPCRLLPAALAAVADGGEIWMLDSANYNTGPVDIGKSVTILAIPGALGSVVALGGPAIQMFSSVPMSVTLRNLNIRPFPGNEGETGVYVHNGVSITVQACNIFGFSSGYGVFVDTALQVTVIDSVFRANQVGALFDRGAKASVTGSHFSLGDKGIGALASATPGQTLVRVSRSTATNNAVGFAVQADVDGAVARLSVIDSEASGNTLSGASAFAGSATATAELAISSSLISGNAIGLLSNGVGGVNAKVIASANQVTFNAVGFSQLTGTFESLGNNAVRGNVADTNGTITTVGGI